MTSGRHHHARRIGFNDGVGVAVSMCSDHVVEELDRGSLGCQTHRMPPFARWQSYFIVEPRKRKSTGIESFAGAAPPAHHTIPPIRSWPGPRIVGDLVGEPLGAWLARRVTTASTHACPRPRQRCRSRAGPFDYASRVSFDKTSSDSLGIVRNPRATAASRGCVPPFTDTPEVPDRREERGKVDDRREHEEEDGVGRDLGARECRQGAECQTAEEEEHRIRRAEPPRECHEDGDDDQDEENKRGCLHRWACLERASVGCRHGGDSSHAPETLTAGHRVRVIGGARSTRYAGRPRHRSRQGGMSTRRSITRTGAGNSRTSSFRGACLVRT